MIRWTATFGLVVIVLLALGLAAFSVVRPQGVPPAAEPGAKSAAGIVAERGRVLTLDDLARLSEADLRKLVEGDGDVDLREIVTDVTGHLDELPKGIRNLNQDYRVPAVRGATSSTGASGRKP